MSDPGTSKPVYGQYHWQVDIADIAAGSDSFLFFSATPPSPTLDGPEFKTWDGKGNPVNSISGGRQVTWAPVTGTPNLLKSLRWKVWRVLERGRQTEKRA